MKTKIKKISLVLFSSLLLASCGKESVGESEAVLQQFKQAVVDLGSGQIDLDLSVKGTSSQQSVDLEGSLAYLFDRRDPQVRKEEAHLKGGGTLSALGELTQADVDVALRTIGEAYYVHLDKLEVDSPEFQTFKLLAEPYMGRWLQVSDQLIPQSLLQLQAQQEALSDEREKMKQIFVSAPLLKVLRDYGVEKVDGRPAYHYQLALDKEGVKEYLRQVAALDNQTPPTEAELEEAAQVADYVESLELWIGKEDYLPYKGNLAFSQQPAAVEGLIPAAQDVDFGFKVAMKMSRFNQELDLQAPEGAEIFDPLKALVSASESGALQPPLVPSSDSGVQPLPSEPSPAMLESVVPEAPVLPQE